MTVSKTNVKKNTSVTVTNNSKNVNIISSLKKSNLYQNVSLIKKTNFVLANKSKYNFIKFNSNS